MALSCALVSAVTRSWPSGWLRSTSSSWAEFATGEGTVTASQPPSGESTASSMLPSLA